MHMNREISCTSWTTEQDRSAKAINRTADVNVQEKSDCAVVLVNQPNKEGQPSAEAGEGRAQTEENIVQSHMHPTQSGTRMSQRLHGVRQVARERTRERFTALLHHLSVGLLRDSIYALQRQARPESMACGGRRMKPDWKIDSSIRASRMLIILPWHTQADLTRCPQGPCALTALLVADPGPELDAHARNCPDRVCGDRFNTFISIFESSSDLLHLLWKQRTWDQPVSLG